MQGQIGHFHWARSKEGPADFRHTQLIVPIPFNHNLGKQKRFGIYLDILVGYNFIKYDGFSTKMTALINIADNKI